VPPHITLYSPFFGPDETDDVVMRRIAGAVDGVLPFYIRVEGIERFPSGVWFLGPVPAEPLLDIIAALRVRFSNIKPNWDQYSDVPHTTLADENVIGVEALSASIGRVSAFLPIRLHADTITWLQRRSLSPAPWDSIASFPLTSI
jgi:2'-5' RNA ligase